MEKGCQKGIINCCYCSCCNSIIVSVFELIISLIGIIINSAVFSFFKKLKDKFNIVFTVNYINISYFGSSSVIFIIILFLRKLKKIEQVFGYKFGSYSTLLYSYISKIIAIINAITFFYLLGFTSLVIMRIDKDKGKKILPVTNVGLHGEIDLIFGTEGVKLDCDGMECYDYEKEEENLPNMDYSDLLRFVFSIIFSFLFMFFNGASFSSENKRISKLVTGKLEIDFIPVEQISLFDTKFCDILNSITCYRLTVLQLLNFMTFLSLLSFACFLSTFIIAIVNPWPQSIFFSGDIAAPIGSILCLFTLAASIYCQNVKCCDFNSPPSKRKCNMIIILIISIIFYPVQLLGFVSIFSSQLGSSSVSIECTDEDPCDDLFTIIDRDIRSKYYFILSVKKAPTNRIITGFILGAIPMFAFFFLMVLMVSYIRRSMNEYNSLNRIYEPKILAVEENGEKVDLDLIEVVTNIMKIQKNKDSKEGEEKNENVVTIYTRRFKINDSSS